jgi:hypothetical protein
MTDRKKRTKADDRRRIVSLQAKAARTPYPAEADACLMKAAQIEARLSREAATGDDGREHGHELAEAPDATVTRTLPDLDLTDQMLLGTACSEFGVRAVRGLFRDSIGLTRRQIQLFGRAGDVAAALELSARLTEHREAGLVAARRALPVLHRTEGNADLFRLSYASQVRQALRQHRTRDVVSTRWAKERDAFVNATVRVSRPTIPASLRRLATSQGSPVWAAADAWAHTYGPAGPAPAGQPSITTA